MNARRNGHELVRDDRLVGGGCMMVRLTCRWCGDFAETGDGYGRYDLYETAQRLMQSMAFDRPCTREVDTP